MVFIILLAWYNVSMSGVLVILSFGAGWLVAQVIKVVLEAFKRKSMQPRDVVEIMMGTGGMPSSHSASVMAMTAYLLFSEGVSSTLFAISLCFSLIVMYDAARVRYAVGEQGKVLNKIVEKVGHRPMKVVEGHTVAQVVVGAVLGILVGFWIAFLTSQWLA